MIAFLVIGGIGFGMLVITWIIGEIFDFGHDLAGLLGHEGAAGAEFDADAGPSPLSSRVIFTFLTAFGGGGAIASIYGQSPLPATLVGLAGGLVMGGGTWFFARMLWRQQASSTVEMSTLVGHRGRVVIGAAGRALAQISLQAGGGSGTFLARSASTADLPAGIEVEITGIEGDTLIVRAVEPGR